MNRLHLLRLSIVGAVFYVGWMARAVTVPLLAAYLMMLVCLPWRQRWRRSIGDIGATLACLAMLLLIPFLLVLPVFLEVDELSAMLPDRDDAKEVQAWVEQNIVAPVEEFRSTLPQSLQDRIAEEDSLQKFGEGAINLLADFGLYLVNFLGGAFGIMSGLVLLPIFLFYLLEGAPWLPRLRGELPKSWHPSFDRTLPAIQNLLRTYCRARLLVALGKGAIVFIALLLFSVPGAYTLGLAVGVFSLLPVIGALISSLGLLFVCFGKLGMAGIGLAIAIYVITELLEGYVLLPRLVGRELGMSDFVVILALLAGGALMGFFGLLIAIPAVAIGQVLYGEYVRPVMRDPEDNEAPDSAPPAPVD